jgi:hypothetical protein
MNNLNLNQSYIYRQNNDIIFYEDDNIEFMNSDIVDNQSEFTDLSLINSNLFQNDSQINNSYNIIYGFVSPRRSHYNQTINFSDEYEYDFTFNTVLNNSLTDNLNYEKKNQNINIISQTFKNFKEQQKININDSLCSICISNYLNNDEVIYLNCSHLFHKECIKEWCTRKNNCPLCRTNIELEK